METEIDVEGKRELAKAFRGVSYDARIDRFTAEIWANGVRRWLGSYSTAQEAASAYQAAAEERGPVVRSQTSFNVLYRDFRNKYGGDRTDPPPGAKLEYDGQVFTYSGRVWRKVNGAKVFYVWESRCKTCSEPYKTMIPAPVSMAKGISRNCPEHVTKGRPAFAKKAAAKPGKVYAEPYTLGEMALVAVEGLSVLDNRVPLSVALQAVMNAISSTEDKARKMIFRLEKIGYAGERKVTFRIDGDVIVFPD